MEVIASSQKKLKLVSEKDFCDAIKIFLIYIKSNIDFTNFISRIKNVI